jgi:hypothetical protein
VAFDSNSLSSPHAPSTRAVLCYHCNKTIDVPSAARTASCPKCNKGIVLDDLRVKDAGWAGKLTTCGKVTVDRKARAVTRSVEAGSGVDVNGVLEAKVQSGGTITLASTSRVKGDFSAPTMVIQPGAVIEGGFFRIGAPFT